MTHRAGGARRRIPRAWILPLLGLALILVGASSGLVSRAILVDLVAWWPIWALVALLSYMGRDARWGRVRVAGLVPLLATAMLFTFGYGYFAGWPLMPSASFSLVGPSRSTADVAALSARVDGDIEVRGGSEFLYQVRATRRGGSTPIAEAVERTQGNSFSVALRPVTDPGFYTFAGWEVALAESIEWDLTLGGDIDADLSSVGLIELHLVGEGEVTLGAAGDAIPVTVEGTFRLSMPETPARVIGEAIVPAGWSQTGDGWVSPVEGDGWVIAVGPGATLVISSP